MAINPTWRTNPTTRIRRVSRAQETSPLHRGRAILHMDAQLAQSQAHWLTTVDAHINGLKLRADAKATRRLIARIVGWHVEWETLCTTTLTWGKLMELTGRARSTVASHLAALHAAGWIGRIAAGRSAAAKQAAGWTGAAAEESDAPVYALTLPLAITRTPPTPGGQEESPARARLEVIPGGAAPRPDPLEAGAASGARTPNHPASPAKPLWPAHARARRKDERVLASAELQARVPALRKLSDKHLASIFRRFFAAEWTIRDLHHAIDYLPDGRRQGHYVAGTWVPYSGADGIPAGRLGHWLRFRLAPWLDSSGTPLESRDQRITRRAAAADVYRQAQHRARAERDARKRVLADDPDVQAAKAHVRAVRLALRNRSTSPATF